MERYELIIRFFEEIGASREAEMYLKLFQKGEPQRFAVIELTSDISSLSLHILSLQLAFLSSLDLYPVIVHGVSLADQKRKQGKFIHWLDGLTKRKPLPERDEICKASEMTLALNETLVSSLNVNDVEAAGLVGGIFHRDENDHIHVHTAQISKSIRKDTLPIVAAMSSQEPICKEKINSSPLRLFDATKALVEKLKPRKIIKIREFGSLRSSNNSPIEYVNLKLHKEQFMNSDMMLKEDKRIISESALLLERLPNRTIVEICSASNLLRELFTQKGAGTLIKAGRSIKIYDSLEDLSSVRLRALIQKAFGRSLIRSYFTKQKEKFKTIIVDPDYKGAVIVKEVEGLNYLDKFAVRPEARGEGIATDLWQMLLHHHDSFFWRSRPDNSINGWYFEKASGCVKTDKWFVFWRNLTEAEMNKAIELAQAIKPTLI